MRKQNFNYCNESFWRGIERVAFVWSQLKFILAPSAMVIHHQPNNTVGGGGFDKKHGKRVEPENERAGVPVQRRNLSCLRQSVVILLVRITTTATLSAVSDIVVTLRCLLKLEKVSRSQRGSQIGSLINLLPLKKRKHNSAVHVFKYDDDRFN